MSKGSLLFLHGWVSGASVWQGVINALPKDCNIINATLPGHGPDSPPWDRASLNPALELLGKTLAGQKTKNAPITAIGWSLGALVIMKYALLNPKSFKSLILVGATPCFVSTRDFPFGQSRAVLRRMKLDMAKDFDGAIGRFYRINFTENELKTPLVMAFLDEFQAERTAMDYSSLINSLDVLVKTDISADVSSMNLPLLLVHGALDRVTPVQASIYLKEKIKDSTLKVIETAGHAPFITQPERFSALLLDFLKAYDNGV